MTKAKKKLTLEVKVLKNLISKRMEELTEEAKQYSTDEDKRWILKLYQDNRNFLKSLEEEYEET